MRVYIVRFEHANHDCYDVLEVYRIEAEAERRVATIANQHTDEAEVAEAFAQGDYAACLAAFVRECDYGADHQIELTATELI